MMDLETLATAGKVVGAIAVFLVCVERLSLASTRTFLFVRLALTLLATSAAAWVVGVWVWPQCNATLSALFTAGVIAYLAAEHPIWSHGSPDDLTHDDDNARSGPGPGD